MKKYIFSLYDEACGSGDEQIFNTEAEAVKAAEAAWFRMCHTDKKRYLDNPISEFRVFEIEVENEEKLEEIQKYYTFEDVEKNNIWNAKIELEVSFRPTHCAEWQTLKRVKGIDEVEKFDFVIFLENETEFLTNCKNIEISPEYKWDHYNYIYICRDITFIDEEDERQIYTYRHKIQEMY